MGCAEDSEKGHCGNGPAAPRRLQAYPSPEACPRARGPAPFPAGRRARFWTPAASALGAVLLLVAASGRLLLPQPAGAQAAVFAWPPVDPADLALQDNPASHGSHAMFLNLEEVVDDPHRFETISARIKVFDEEGKKYGDFELPYNEDETEILEIHARTVNPDGTSLEFQGQVFDQLVVKTKKLKYHAKVFTLPDVQAGSIIDYSYQRRWRKDAPEWLKDPGKIQLIGPVAYSWRTASWQIQRDLFIRRGHFVLKPYPKAALGWSTFGLAPGGKPQKNPDGTFELEAKNVAALQEEDFMPPESTYRSRVEFFYMVGSHSSPDSFWNQIGRQNADFLDTFLSKHKRVDRLAAETVAANDPPETKLRKLYERAQKIRNLSHEHERTEKELKQEHLNENKSVDDVAEHGYAWANQTNYLFAALARSAGFNARIVFLMSKEKGVFSTQVMDQSQLNAEVVMVHLEDRDLYLDPAEHLCTFPLLPWYEAGAGGIRVETGGGFTTTTPPLASADSVITRKSSLHLDKDGVLQGKLEVIFTGQSAFVRRKEMADEDAAGRRKNLEDSAKAWLPSGATVELSNSSGWDDATIPLRAEFTVSIPNQTVSTPTRLLLPLALTVAGKRNPFQHAYRIHTVDLRYPYQEIDEVTLALPQGFDVEAIPAARARSGPAATYELSTTRLGESLVVKRKLVVGNTYYRVEAYPALRAFFSAVKSGDQDRAVLRQVKNAAQR
jgi:Domain of Unknown Function with PDB structure (DUF3857)/Transglutaminase-like superfamily